MTDYLRLARLLREKAAYVPPEGSGLQPVPETERLALIARAEELERKYGNGNSPSGNNTTTTSRDGRFNPFARPPGWKDRQYDYTFFFSDDLFQRFNAGTSSPQTAEASAEQQQRSWQTLYILLKNQHHWNKTPDEEDLVEEGYKHDYDEDEDYGYDMFEGDDTP